MCAEQTAVIFEKKGFCPICEAEVTFSARQNWFRDFLLCNICGSIPRERALFYVITMFYPNYRDLKIHETSPSNRGASVRLRHQVPLYSASQYYPSLNAGQIHSSGFQNENIESMTFQSESFDLFISQDVMEHVFNPGRAFKEIARVLKPGGAHIFTVPLVNKSRKSEQCASLQSSGKIEYHKTPEYHGNPVSDQGSLVTMHWGYDISDVIQEKTGMPSTIVLIDNIELGIRAEYIEVLVSRKY
jgi:SAM-dependent methyltransferase